MAAKEDVNKIATIPGQIEIAPVRAAGAVLTAKDLNTKLGNNGKEKENIIRFVRYPERGRG